MGFMTSIINALNSVSSWFYQIYLEVYGWVYPFWLAAGFFYQLCSLFNTLAWQFYYFSSWVSDVAAKVAEILNWSTIWSYILSYVPNLTQIRDWFYSWWSNVTSVVTSWWSTTQYTVQGWISTAAQPFNAMLTAWNSFWNSLWPQLTGSFNSLKSAWDNFWGVTFPTLVSFSWLTTWWSSRLQDVQGLINSSLKTWFPFYDDLVKLWSSLTAFFTNPVEFIWERFADWFLGPEV